MLAMYAVTVATSLWSSAPNATGQPDAQYAEWELAPFEQTEPLCLSFKPQPWVGSSPPIHLGFTVYLKIPEEASWGVQVFICDANYDPIGEAVIYEIASEANKGQVYFGGNVSDWYLTPEQVETLYTEGVHIRVVVLSNDGTAGTCKLDAVKMEIE